MDNRKTIYLDDAIDAIDKRVQFLKDDPVFRRKHGDIDLYGIKPIIRALPSAQPEPLTDKEQRIFLAAMGREEKVCKEVDRNFVLEPYEDSLVRTCHEITRKVKGALWTT